MNLKTYVRTRKNLAHWAAHIKKMEGRDELCAHNRALHVEALMARDDELDKADAIATAEATFATPPVLTEEELDDIEGRKAQCQVWIRELRNAEKKGLSDSDDIPGEISASSGVATAESAAGATG